MYNKNYTKSYFYHYTCTYVVSGEIFTTSGGKAHFKQMIALIDKQYIKDGYSTKKIFSKAKYF